MKKSIFSPRASPTTRKKRNGGVEPFDIYKIRKGRDFGETVTRCKAVGVGSQIDVLAWDDEDILAGCAAVEKALSEAGLKYKNVGRVVSIHTLTDRHCYEAIDDSISA